MLNVEIEGEWFSELPERPKLLFLAVLSHELTIAGRGSYKIQTEELAHPAWLRRINEIQHRVSACMHHVLLGSSLANFERSLAPIVLEQSDPELRQFTVYAWRRSKQRLSREA
jgi:hypothetical protein